MSEKHLICQDCGKQNEIVEKTTCPYEQDINDDIVDVTLCPHCYYERCMDI